METNLRSKVAAATASVVPFHCVICFEEFCLKDRTPVVLPCGHTFVCAPCSKKIKRCMECREPLFLTVPKTATTNRGGGVVTSHHLQAPYGRYSPTPSTPPQHYRTQQQASVAHSTATTLVPLPIPKNVVLIAMMEAAQRQEREKMDGSMEAADEEEEYDLNRIITGMATLSGPCGTYAVKDDLALLSTDPREPKDDKADDDGSEITNINLSLSQSASGEIEIGDSLVLKRGATVQVVDFQDGVAKLARGAGYIMASSSQLVKIGGPMEKSCRLEGLLDTVKSRGRDLKNELDENDVVEASIRAQIEAVLEVEPSHPVVKEAPQNDEMSQVNSREACSTPTDANKMDDISQPFLRTPDVSPDLIINEGPRHVDENGVSAFMRPASFPSSPYSIDNADLNNPGLPSYRLTSDTFDDAVYGCGATFLGGSSLHLFDNSDNSSENRGLLTGLTYRSGSGNNENRERSYSSEGHHPRQLSPTLTSSFDTIDFRTGLSGHRGLNNAKKSHHYAAGGSPNLRSRYMMSEHRGIGRARGPLNKSSTSNTP